MKEKRLRGWLCGILLLLAVLTGVCAWEIYRSYHGLEEQEYTIRSDKVDAPVTLAVISDLHDHEFGQNNEELVEKIRNIDPDVILMDGDMLNDISEDDHVVITLLEQLTGDYPVYYSLGNHEENYMARQKSKRLWKDIQNTGAVLLDQTYKRVSINGNPICIGGMYDYAFEVDGAGHMSKKDMDPKTLTFLETFQKEEEYKIMMAHRPDSFIFGEAWRTWNIDLVISGHDHGGQVILPGVGGIYGGDQGWLPKYDYGEFHFDTVKNMIITRGLSSDKKVLPRFHNPPEIVTIHLERAK